MCCKANDFLSFFVWSVSQSQVSHNLEFLLKMEHYCNYKLSTSHNRKICNNSWRSIDHKRAIALCWSAFIRQFSYSNEGDHGLGVLQGDFFRRGGVGTREFNHPAGGSEVCFFPCMQLQVRFKYKLLLAMLAHSRLFK